MEKEDKPQEQPPGSDLIKDAPGDEANYTLCWVEKEDRHKFPELQKIPPFRDNKNDRPPVVADAPVPAPAPPMPAGKLGNGEAKFIREGEEAQEEQAPSPRRSLPRRAAKRNQPADDGKKNITEYIWISFLFFVCLRFVCVDVKKPSPNRKRNSEDKEKISPTNKKKQPASAAKKKVHYNIDMEDPKKEDQMHAAELAKKLQQEIPGIQIF